MPVMEGITNTASFAIDAVRGLSDAIAGLVDASVDFVNPGLDAAASVEAFADTLDQKAAKSLREYAAVQKLAGYESEHLATLLKQAGVAAVNQADLMDRLATISVKSGTAIELVTDAAADMADRLVLADLPAKTITERTTLWREEVGALYEQFGLVNPLIDANTEAVNENAAAVSEDQRILNGWFKTTEEGRAVHLGMIETLAKQRLEMLGIVPPVKEVAQSFDRAAAKAALLAGGMEELNAIDAPKTLREIRQESNETDKVWKRLIQRGDGNKKAVRELTDEIGKWERRFKKAVDSNDSEAADYAADQLGRLKGERTARQGIIDAIDRLTEAIKNLPASTQTRFDTPGLDSAVTNVRLLRDAINSVPNRKTVTLAAVKAGVAAFLHTGGPAEAGHPYVVGERGPEWFVPNVSGRVVNQQQAAAAVGTQVVEHRHTITAEGARNLRAAGFDESEVDRLLRVAEQHNRIRRAS
jgi:hypothetical protein